MYSIKKIELWALVLSLNNYQTNTLSNNSRTIMAYATTASKKFCKFCYDSGRGDFDSHCTRDRSGKLTCRFLASNCCTRCGENGHTVKYCKAKIGIKEVDDRDGWSNVGGGKGFNGPKENVKSFAKPVGVGGGFFALMIDDSDLGDDGLGDDGLGDDGLGEGGLVDGDRVTINWGRGFGGTKIHPATKKSWADIVEEESGQMV